MSRAAAQNDRYLRFTFWVVVGLAFGVVTLLGLQLFDVAERADQAQGTADANAALIEENRALLDEVISVSEGQIDAIFCLVVLPLEERSQAAIEGCLGRVSVP
jgi:hypothetical protein